MSADIFDGQPSDADQLAELYDLEHDQVTEDLAFYREMASRARGPVLDLGCGSGRLFISFLAAGAPRVVGVDGTPALLRRARARIASSAELSRAEAEGRLHVMEGDLRHLHSLRIRGVLGSAAGLVVLAGVLPHLDGPDQALDLFARIRGLLAPRGILVLDDLGPGMLPTRDLPLSVDWRRSVEGREVVRRSQLMVRNAPEGLRVAFSTIVDVGRPDGTIARLPASHRLWYPSSDALTALVGKSGMAVELAYGTHDLDALAADSDRRILLVKRVVQNRGDRPGAPDGAR